ncbi:hypothetical protein RN001_010293 [Aquatica leii]|uniref:Ubiquitin carboxyl-terminal hydrolase n=1 Tax=Aquatica leii TaxID=1421715 RepID=A0AAN7SEC9_9COLE|nr:hypothetical protein RN001_010293 [Aquatica leii]
MPVPSPRRSTIASTLTGSYRPTLNTSNIDRSYYPSSNACAPRIGSYSERYSTRTFTDSEGRKVIQRQGSITEDGITTRFKEETREGRDSNSRDSGSNRDSSVSRLSAINVAESVAEMRTKYSPSNYVPACLRGDNITRSKSINDIGKPPIERSGDKKYKVNESFSNGLSVTNLSNNTNSLEKMCDNVLILNEDDNGNRASVAEIRKKFDQSNPYKGSKSESLCIRGVKISENRFKKQDKDAVCNKMSECGYLTKKDKGDSLDSRLYEKRPAKLSKLEVESNCLKEHGYVDNEKRMSDSVSVAVGIDSNFDNLSQKCLVSDINRIERGLKFTVSGQLDDTGALRNGLDGEKSTENLLNDPREFYRNYNHTSDFASYIPLKNLPHQGDGDCNEEILTNGSDILLNEGNDMENRNIVNENSRYYHSAKLNSDIASSPRINRAIAQNTSTASTSSTNNITSHNYQRASHSLDREGKGSPVTQLGLNGLKNIGNTCFMNSVVQCLSNTKLLLEYVKNDTYIPDINTSISSMKGALIKAFSQVIKELWSEDSSDRVVNTVSLKSQIQRFAPRFMGYSQQDAQEFLRYLLEGLHEDVNRVTVKPAPILTEIDEKLSDGEKSFESWQRYLRMDNSRVVDIFVGQLKSTLRCTHCGHCSVTFDPFWDLSLPLPQRAGPLRLQQCLDSFTREETLDGDEKPTCSKCKERRKCTKSFAIQKFPKILVIHLKRFSPTERFRGKLSVSVDFPLENLDMRNYAAENSPSECRYNLYAISNHSGTTYSGHYTAYCRHPYSHAWHEYNDSRVSNISSKALISGEAYVLFYELDSQKSRL